MPFVICRYSVRAGAEEAFRALLSDHWPTLRRLDFVTSFKPIHLQRDADGAPEFVEIFEWRPEAASAAHEHPEVAAVWERMDALVEARGGRPKWAFTHFERFDPDGT